MHKTESSRPRAAQLPLHCEVCALAEGLLALLILPEEIASVCVYGLGKNEVNWTRFLYFSELCCVVLFFFFFLEAAYFFNDCIVLFNRMA